MVDLGGSASPPGERKNRFGRSIRRTGEGTPEEVAAKAKSYTGHFLKSYLNGDQEAKSKKAKGNSRKKKTARKRTTANKRKN